MYGFEGKYIQSPTYVDNSRLERQLTIQKALNRDDPSLRNE